MDNRLLKRQELRRKRAMRVRKQLRGNATKPRLCVVKTNAHIQVQLIDDEMGVTLASIGTLSKEFQQTDFAKKNRTSARKLGQRIAELAKEKNVETVIFDRGRFCYHGILAELADAARECGLKF